MSIVVNGSNAFKAITKIGEKINSPQQRLILGATALATQPFIDLNNKKVDKDTRAASVARTIAKIIAGTIVGVAIRAGSINLIKKLSNAELKTINGVQKICKKSKKDIFVPVFAKLKPNTTIEEFRKQYNKYTQALGTFLGSVAMIYTNFKVDAPLTRWGTSQLTDDIKKYINKTETGGKK